MSIEQKWEMFTQSVSVMRPIVACVGCGSSLIDHKPAGRLRCCHCGTSSHWSPDRFKIVRDRRSLQGPELEAFAENVGRDFGSGMDSAEKLKRREMTDDGDWYSDVVRAVEAFLDAASEVSAMNPSERLDATRAAFNDMRDQIQTTLDSVAP